MSKVYQYRKHIRWGQYVIAAVFLIAIIAWVIAGVNLYSMSKTINPSSPFPLILLMIFACMTIFFLAEGVLLWYLYYRLAGVRVILEDNSIIYKHRTGETKINFANITKIGLPSIPYIGGWITIIAGKEKIRLTVVVNEISDFVQNLKASLDNISLANRYDESRLFRFLKTAAFADQSWDRMYVIFLKYIFATIGTGLLGIGVAKISGSGGFLWIMFSFIYPTLVYTVTEIVYGVKLAKTAKREMFFVPARDIVYENSVYRIAVIVGGVIYFITALMIFILS